LLLTDLPRGHYSAVACLQFFHLLHFDAYLFQRFNLSLNLFNVLVGTIVHLDGGDLRGSTDLVDELACLGSSC